MELKLLAADIAEIYMQNTKVESVLLGGSISRNLHDRYSDIELFVLWKENPTDEDRKSTVDTVGGKIIDFYPYEEEEWSETYITKGIKLEISNFLTSTVKSVIHDVTVSFETDLDKQCLVATVHDGLALGGEKVIAELKKKAVVYPPELGEAMIRENIDFGTRWNNREALIAREDWLMFYGVVVSVQTKMMGILFGLNQLYVHHPAYKWQKYSLDTMAIVPNDIAERFDFILKGDPKDSVKELEAITQELYPLIQNQYPTMELSDAIGKILFVRPDNG